jgi:hypothetical protein
MKYLAVNRTISVADNFVSAIGQHEGQYKVEHCSLRTVSGDAAVQSSSCQEGGKSVHILRTSEYEIGIRYIIYTNNNMLMRFWY